MRKLDYMGEALVLTILALSSFAFTQDNPLPYEESELVISENIYYTLYEVVSKSEDWSSAKQKSGTLSIILEKLPLKGKYAKDDWKSWKFEFLSLKKEEIINNFYFWHWQRTLNPEIVKLYIRQSGFWAWVQYHPDNERLITLHMLFKPLEGESPQQTQVKKLVISPEDAVSYAKPSLPLSVGSQGELLQITRLKQEGITINITPSIGKSVSCNILQQQQRKTEELEKKIEELRTEIKKLRAEILKPSWEYKVVWTWGDSGRSMEMASWPEILGRESAIRWPPPRDIGEKITIEKLNELLSNGWEVIAIGGGIDHHHGGYREILLRRWRE